MKTKPTQNEYPKTISNRYGKVNIYRQKTGGYWISYVVQWRVGKARHRKCFADKSDAETHAENVLENFARGEAALSRLTNHDLVEYETCKRKMPPGVPLIAAVECYNMYYGLGTDTQGSPVSDVRDAYIKELHARGNKPRDLETVKSHLKSFCESFVNMPITAVKATDIDRYLQEKQCSNRTRNNIRVTLGRLWRWARKKRFLPKNGDCAAELSTRYKSEVAASPGIFTPKEMAALISCAEERWVPYFAIAAWAGLRQAEIMRLTWADIDFEQNVIILGANVTKTNKRRVAHMPDNLVEWLSAHPKKEGKICPGSRPNVETGRAAKAAGVKWMCNGLRHSYISYQMAIWRDAAKVAEQCGNSEAQVQSSYKANALETEARKWFSIEPDFAEPTNQQKPRTCQTK